jgi:hypothetical protein
MYAKGIKDIEKCDPPGGISSDEFKKVNPSGQIPGLFVAVNILPAFGMAKPLAEMTAGLKARMGGA